MDGTRGRTLPDFVRNKLGISPLHRQPDCARRLSRPRPRTHVRGETARLPPVVGLVPTSAKSSFLAHSTCRVAADPS